MGRMRTAWASRNSRQLKLEPPALRSAAGWTSEKRHPLLEFNKLGRSQRKPTGEAHVELVQVRGEIPLLISVGAGNPSGSPYAGPVQPIVSAFVRPAAGSNVPD